MSLKKKQKHYFLFGKRNYMIMLIGLVILVLGYILMRGGYNADPTVWDDSVLYGFRTTVLAPILVLIGLGLQIVAIFANSHDEELIEKEKKSDILDDILSE